MTSRSFTNVDPLLEEDFDLVAIRNPQELQEITNAHVVLTGASGFVGKWLIGSWLSAKKFYGGPGRLLLTCRNPSELEAYFPGILNRTDIEVCGGDIRKFEIPSSFKPDYLIHGATSASDSLNRSNPREMISVILDGTRRALDSAVQAGVKKFVFLSSGAVYGQHHPVGTLLKEDSLSGPSLHTPTSAYHESKRLAELMCNIEAAQGTLAVVNLRLFTFLAPYLPMTTHFAAGNFIVSAMRNEPIVIKSGGGSVRSYMYGSDLASSIFLSTQRNLSSSTYNVGSPSQVRIDELARQIRDIVNPKCTIEIQGIDTEENVTTYVPDTSLADSELTFGVRLDLSRAIQKTISWLRIQCDIKG
jgi:dTDP-glucose 4,6-dehydratase